MSAAKPPKRKPHTKVYLVDGDHFSACMSGHHEPLGNYRTNLYAIDPAGDPDKPEKWVIARCRWCRSIYCLEEE